MPKLSGKTRDFLRLVLPACAAGNLEAVQTYLQDARDFVRWIGPHGRTMLWEAARKGHLSLVKLLVDEQRADPRALGCYYRETRVEVSPWLAASLHGRSATADFLDSRGAGLDFLAACFLGDGRFARSWLTTDPRAAARPVVREHRWNGYRAWPLQYAIAGRQPSLVEQLLAAGADPGADPRILFDAIDTDQPGIAELLLAAGADPRPTKHRRWLVSQEYRTLASRYGHEILPRDVAAEKWPAIVDACRGNHNAPDDPRRVARLIGQGHDVNSLDYKGKTPLHRASQAGFLAISALLLKHGAHLDARSPEGETPLFDAAFHGRAGQIRLLIEAGADLEARNNRGETAIFAAIRGGQGESLRVLHSLGAPLGAVNDRGQTPREVAWRSRKRGIEKVREILDLIAPDGARQ